MLDVIKDYLVAIGFAVNANQFNQTKNKINEMGKHVHAESVGVSKDVTAMLSNVTKGATATAAALATVTAGIVGMVVKTAQMDMEYQKFGRRMWMNTQYAKEFKMSLDAMGESMEDIAFNPELRNQFEQLRNLSGQMNLPGDAAGQFKDFRQILFGFKQLKLEIMYASQWISYYLLKYFDGPLCSIKNALQDLNKNIVQNMPEWTKKAAQYLGSFISVVASGVRFIKDLYTGFERFFNGLPKMARVALLALGGLSLLLLSGPVGQIIAGLSFAMLLIEDFYAYMDGRKSSKTLAPVWKILTDLFNQKGSFSGIFELIKELLKSAAYEAGNLSKSLDDIFGPRQKSDAIINLGLMLKTINDLSAGIANVIKKVRELFDSASKSGPLKIVFDGFKTNIKLVADTFNMVQRTLLTFLDVMGLVLQGKFKEAKKLMNTPLSDIGKDAPDGGDGSGGSSPPKPGSGGGEGATWQRSDKNVNVEKLTPNAKGALDQIAQWYYIRTGKKLTVTSGYRTWQGQHGHNQGIKFDAVGDALKKDPNLRKDIIAYAKSLGIVVTDEYANLVPWATGGHLDFNASKYKPNSYMTDIMGRSSNQSNYNVGGNYTQIGQLIIQVPNTNATAQDIANVTVNKIQQLNGIKTMINTRELAGVS